MWRAYFAERDFDDVDVVNLAAAGGIVAALWCSLITRSHLGQHGGGGGDGNGVAGGRLFEHDFAISAISTR